MLCSTSRRQHSTSVCSLGEPGLTLEMAFLFTIQVFYPNATDFTEDQILLEKTVGFKPQENHLALGVPTSP